MDPGDRGERGAHLKLAWWQEEIAATRPRRTAVIPITRFLARAAAAARVDFAPLDASLEAAARQIAGAPLEHGTELEAHSARAARGAAHDRRAPCRRAAPESGRRDSAERAVAALAAADISQTRSPITGAMRLAGVSIFPVDELLAAGIEDADLIAAEPPAHLQAYLEGLRRRAARALCRRRRAVAARRAGTRCAICWFLRRSAPSICASARRARAARVRPADLYLAWTTARRAARTATVRALKRSTACRYPNNSHPAPDLLAGRADPDHRRERRLRPRARPRLRARRRERDLVGAQRARSSIASTTRSRRSARPAARHRACSISPTATAADYDRLAETIGAEFGKLDGLVHAAALLGDRTPLEQYDVPTWCRVLHVNLTAPFILTQVLLPNLRKSRDASVIFVSSGVVTRIRAPSGAPMRCRRPDWSRCAACSSQELEGEENIFASTASTRAACAPPCAPPPIRRKIRTRVPSPAS